MVIEIPFCPKSMNELIGMYFRARSKYNSETKEAIAWICKQYKPVKKYPVDISYTIVKKSKHKGDSDNMVAKVFTDGLVAGGILKDDSTDYVRRVSYELQYGEEDKTIIEIKEV